jgi:hypothetical protein
MWSRAEVAREMPVTSLAMPQISLRRTFGRSRRSGPLIAMALALSCATCQHSPPVLSAFRTEQQARDHCPNDAIVWVDPQSGTYQLKGHGSYGLSDTGRYACRGEAERVGMHATAN